MLIFAAQADPWFGTDKALHFGGAAVISGSGYAFAAAAFEDPVPRFLIGGGLGLIAASAKELADLAGLGQPSWKDWAWSAAGAGFGVLVAWLIQKTVEVPQSPVSGAPVCALLRATTCAQVWLRSPYWPPANPRIPSRTPAAATPE
jgi:uncharacterized protein YfiM (DUF2279 family)